LTVVPGSHRWATHYRPFGDQLERGPFRDVIPLIRRLEQPLYMKAGEAVFYHARTIHGSFPNDSDKLRVATLSAVVPVEADLFFYHRIDDHRVEKFRITEDFYWNDYFVYTRPHRAESLGVLEWVPPKAFDEQSLLDAIAGDRRP
jgi:ectoine hydroxylase-related dioxygenase (phytanoyl-CoA dioxygenase family)